MANMQPNIVFRTDDEGYQQEQYQKFQTRGILHTRYPDESCLRKLGLYEAIQWM